MAKTRASSQKKKSKAGAEEEAAWEGTDSEYSFAIEGKKRGRPVGYKNKNSAVGR
jgi:hypothetical protein